MARQAILPPMAAPVQPAWKQDKPQDKPQDAKPEGGEPPAATEGEKKSE
jgi:hypothetical protein